MVGAAARLTAAALAACWSLPALAATAAAVDAPDSGWRIAGQCREGQPQGGYMLRAGDGRLRVQGAFNQGQRVGSFIFWTARGTRVAHVPFDADRINGTLSLWYDEAADDRDGPRKLVAGYRAGERHGLTRSWYADGRLRAEYDYREGALISARAWSDAGLAYDEARSRAMADADRAVDAEYLDALLATVRRHLPDCAPPPAQQHA